MASTAGVPVYMLPGVAVCQPPHLEGDPALATEILPGPPPLVSLQQPGQKRDPKKPAVVYSYLPASDPGTTYSGIVHGTLIGQDSIEATGKRTGLDKSAITGRAQRASARNHPNMSTPAEQLAATDVVASASAPPIYADSDTTMVLDDTPTLSRSTSFQNLSEIVSTNGRAKRKGKGKGKEVDPSVQVKEEPSMAPMLTPEPSAPHALPNEDHCSSCQSQGSQLVYCDGCPKAFHLWCLDPPLEKIDEGDTKWFCPACNIRKHPPRKPQPSSMPDFSSLLHLIDTSIPTEYHLPSDIRSFYKNVATGARGAYVDSSEIKPPRLNRFGQQEDREPYKLKDRNGDPVLCHRCGTSAIPDNLPATKRPRRSTSKPAQDDMWKNIVSCDYCDLHWHLDCLDPPLSTMPVFPKKWMCPNHVERILPSRHRVPKAAEVVEITKPGRPNNGNIEIIPSQTQLTSQSKPAYPVEEVYINGRRYRVPERIVLLDFWSKVMAPEDDGDADRDSGVPSPLTPLSSESEHDDTPMSDASRQDDDLVAANMLRDFQLGRTNPTSSPTKAKSSKRHKPNGSESATVPLSKIDDKLRQLWPALKPPTARSSSGPPSTTAKRKRSTTGPGATRELRSSRGVTRNGDASSSSSKSASRAPEDGPSAPTAAPASATVASGSTSAPNPMTPPAPRKIGRVKLEEDATALLAAGNGASTSRVPRTVRGARKSAPEGESSAPVEDKPKRGKKRKDRDEDGDYVSKGIVAAANAAQATAKGRRKSVRTPAVVPPSPPAEVPAAPAPAPMSTPLKIRLRLGPPATPAAATPAIDITRSGR